MTQLTHTQKKLNWRPLLAGLVGVALLAAAGAAIGPTVMQVAQANFAAAPGPATSAPQTVTVSTLTAETYVTSVGPVLPAQSGTVAWETTGNVASVLVHPGDLVQAGQPLMSLDPLSVPQAVILAQADLVTAQRARDDLVHPPALALAQAQKNVSSAQKTLDDMRQPPAVTVALAWQAVAKAQDTLDKARKTLANTNKPDLKYYQDQLKTAQDALTNARQDTTLIDIGQLPVDLRTAQKQLETATNVYNNARDGFAKCPACEKVWAYDRMTNWTDAQNLYNDAVNLVQQLQLQIDQSQRGNSQSVSSAQDALDKAQRNLTWAMNGPDTITVGVNQAAVDVAESSLADAQDKLNKLLNPDPADVALAEANLADTQEKLDHLQHGADPRDLAVAQARLEAAQAAVSVLTLTAPFEGEVLAVNCRAGDGAAPAQAAVTLANRNVLKVEAQVDEADMGHIAVGQAVSVTFETLPGVVLAGRVTWINGSGVPVQGVVKYTVRVETPQSDPRVLLGMTANVSILTQRQAGALALPPSAVLRDDQGEYVNRIKGGQVERVNVVSGQVQDGLLVVAGDLRPDDEVELPNGGLP